MEYREEKDGEWKGVVNDGPDEGEEMQCLQSGAMQLERRQKRL